MMKEQVCITPVTISKAGQVKHFQIKLPKTAKKVIGVEIGGRFLRETKGKEAIAVLANVSDVPKTIEPVRNELQTYANGTVESQRTPFKRNTLIGDLKLQSCEEANIFYAGELRIDNNLHYGDFSNNRFWRAEPFTHQMQTFEDVVITNADSTILLGMYKDNIGLETKRDMNYTVNVYVWYSK